MQFPRIKNKAATKAMKYAHTPGYRNDNGSNNLPNLYRRKSNTSRRTKHQQHLKIKPKMKTVQCKHAITNT